MRELDGILNDIVFAFASLRRAKTGVEVPELHAIYCWLENSHVKLHYHLNKMPTAGSEDNLSGITGEVMSDYDLDSVDESWGMEIPEEREKMIVWIINPVSTELA